MAAKTMAVALGFDLAFGMRNVLSEILQHDVKLIVFTENKGVYETITKRTTVPNKRVMIKLAVIREAYEKGGIASVGFIRSEHNPANGMTKKKTVMASC
mmetsp:Transcript_18009/g.31283  ORF Transcript_18009/g.31283 Transcript_18009/m.31283 type:complete len:99 (+) Transcript_18009:295-591(+)|eukprot:CAMPEP_0184701842 /NCGR_PEP_ID=MMETSP0313-20130426/21846_1 /TAXON_ID=2792 /ORGANISM="Porphyridium aerugineum, Strain SAG 1380-2" /LENGTH=98 /DNA_ID=CAMNT_0027162083 /DNA_START=278 /DNA_END=574 /DNA_ORIENTATION=+